MENIAAIIGIFATSFIIAFSGALMPGPLLTFTIAETGRRGFSAGPLLILGHGILELLIVIVLLAGVGPFLKLDAVSGVIGLAGAIVLSWLAFGIFRSIPTLTLSSAAQQTTPITGWRNRKRGPVLFGVVMSLANPYWTLWWVTIGLGYITVSMKFGPIGVAAFFIGHILADLVWYSAVSFSFSKGTKFLSNGVYRRIMAVCAAALVVFAVWFGWHGVELLMSFLM